MEKDAMYYEDVHELMLNSMNSNQNPYVIALEFNKLILKLI